MAEIITQYMTENPCYKKGRKIAVKGLMLHSIGCPQPNPEVFVKNWNNPSYNKACVHGFIGLDKIFITLPCMENTSTSGHGIAHRAWHCGAGSKGSANNTHIGIEMCEPSCIKYVGGCTFTIKDKDKPAAIAFVKQCTENAVDLFAKLCKYHNLNPLEPGVIIDHNEGHDLGIASDHSDVHHLWSQLGMNYDMNKFRKDVYNKMNNLEEDDDNMTAEKFTELMREYRATLQNNNCNSYSEDARNWAIKNGFLQGTGAKDANGNPIYAYTDFLTREQFVTVLYRFAKAKGLE